MDVILQDHRLIRRYQGINLKWIAQSHGEGGEEKEQKISCLGKMTRYTKRHTVKMKHNEVTYERRVEGKMKNKYVTTISSQRMCGVTRCCIMRRANQAKKPKKRIHDTLLRRIHD